MQQLNLTPKQKEIPPLLYRFRFLDRIQIQHFLNNKNHRNIHTWLNNLVKQKLLGRIYDTSPSGRIQPAIYYTDLGGVKYLRKYTEYKEYLGNMYKEDEKSKEFIDRCRFIANIYLDLRSRNTDVESFDFFAKPDFPRDETTKELKPDFGFIRYQGRRKTFYVCKIMETGIPRRGIKARVEKYVEEFKDKANTKLIFICETDEHFKFTERYVKKHLEKEEITDLPITVFTAAEVKTEGILKKKEHRPKKTADSQ